MSRPNPWPRALLALAVAALILLLLATRQCPAANLWDWSPPAAHHRAAVTVVATDGSAGSGVYVHHADLALVLTAAHIVQGSSTARVGWQDGSTTSGRVSHDKFGHDIAYVLARNSNVTPLAVAETAAPGARVELLGYGGPRDRLRHFWGRILSGGGQNYIRTDANVTYGDSGGAWLDASQQVIGIQSTGADPVLSRVRSQSGASWSIFDSASSAHTRHISAFVRRAYTQLCPGGT